MVVISVASGLHRYAIQVFHKFNGPSVARIILRFVFIQVFNFRESKFFTATIRFEIQFLQMNTNYLEFSYAVLLLYFVHRLIPTMDKVKDEA